MSSAFDRTQSPARVHGRVPRPPRALLGVAVFGLFACSEPATTVLGAPFTANHSRAAKPSSDTPLRWEIPAVADGSLKIQGSANALTSLVSIETGASQAYVFDDGTCGIKALLHNNGGGDATVQPNANWSGLRQSAKNACGGSPLAFTFQFPDAVASSSDNQNVWAVGDPVDLSRRGIAVFAAGSVCGQLRYGSTDLVTRDLPQVTISLLSQPGAKRIWRVESTLDPTTGRHLAYCSLSGQTYDMPFVFYIYEK